MSFKFKFKKKSGVWDKYEGLYFRYQEKYYKILRVEYNTIYFSLPGTLLNNSKETRGNYYESKMPLGRFEDYVNQGDYHVIDSCKDPVPTALLYLKL